MTGCVWVYVFTHTALHFAAFFDRRATATMLLDRPECDIGAKNDEIDRKNGNICKIFRKNYLLF